MAMRTGRVRQRSKWRARPAMVRRKGTNGSAGEGDELVLQEVSELTLLYKQLLPHRREHPRMEANPPALYTNKGQRHEGSSL